MGRHVLTYPCAICVVLMCACTQPPRTPNAPFPSHLDCRHPYKESAADATHCGWIASCEIPAWLRVDGAEVSCRAIMCGSVPWESVCYVTPPSQRNIDRAFALLEGRFGAPQERYEPERCVQRRVWKWNPEETIPTSNPNREISLFAAPLEGRCWKYPSLELHIRQWHSDFWEQTCPCATSGSSAPDLFW